MKPDSLPLATPDGEVLTWACGVCRRVRCAVEPMAPPDAEQRASLAVDYKRDADDCCHCEKCGAVEPGVFRECSACAAARKAEWDAGMPERLTQQAVEDAACEATYDLALDRVAAHALAERMSAISEDCYCAGWMMGLEFALWSFVLNGPEGYGQGRVSEDDVAALKSLSEKAGGWIVFRMDRGMMFVPMAEWLSTYANDAVAP